MSDPQSGDDREWNRLIEERDMLVKALKACKQRLEYISAQSCADHEKHGGVGWWESDLSIEAAREALAKVGK